MYSQARFKLDTDDKVIQAGRFDKLTQEEQQKFLVRVIIIVGTFYAGSGSVRFSNSGRFLKQIKRKKTKRPAI